MITIKPRVSRVVSLLSAFIALSGCSTVSTPPAHPRESVAKVLQAYADAMESGDYTDVHFAPDVTFLGPLTNGPISGEASVRAFLLKVSADVKDVRVKRQVIDGDSACVIAELETKGGKVVPFCECFRIVNGKLAEIHPYFDPRPLIQ
jgi:limonene-1,2-epoxide hydrolase